MTTNYKLPTITFTDLSDDWVPRVDLSNRGVNFPFVTPHERRKITVEIYNYLSGIDSDSPDSERIVNDQMVRLITLYDSRTHSDYENPFIFQGKLFNTKINNLKQYQQPNKCKLTFRYTDIIDMFRSKTSLSGDVFRYTANHFTIALHEFENNMLHTFRSMPVNKSVDSLATFLFSVCGIFNNGVDHAFEVASCSLKTHRCVINGIRPGDILKLRHLYVRGLLMRLVDVIDDYLFHFNRLIPIEDLRKDSSKLITPNSQILGIPVLKLLTSGRSVRHKRLLDRAFLVQVPTFDSGFLSDSDSDDLIVAGEKSLLESGLNNLKKGIFGPTISTWDSLRTAYKAVWTTEYEKRIAKALLAGTAIVDINNSRNPLIAIVNKVIQSCALTTADSASKEAQELKLLLNDTYKTFTAVIEPLRDEIYKAEFAKEITPEEASESIKELSKLERITSFTNFFGTEAVACGALDEIEGLARRIDIFSGDASALVDAGSLTLALLIMSLLANLGISGEKRKITPSLIASHFRNIAGGLLCATTLVAAIRKFVVENFYQHMYGISYTEARGLEKAPGLYSWLAIGSVCLNFGENEWKTHPELQDFVLKHFNDERRDFMNRWFIGLPKSAKTTEFDSYYKSIVKRMVLMSDTCAEFSRDSYGTKAEPMMLVITGEPGMGKSVASVTATQVIEKHVLGHKRCTPGAYTWWAKDMQRQDHVKGTEYIYLVDELYNKIPDIGHTEDIDLTFQAKQAFYMPLEAADLPKKGKIIDRRCLTIALTNCTHFDNEHVIYNNEAFKRRMNLVYFSTKEEWTKDNEFNSGKPTLDFEKYSKMTYEPYVWENFTQEERNEKLAKGEICCLDAFTVQRMDAQKGKIIGGKVSFYQYMLQVAADLNRRQAIFKQKREVLKLSSMRTDEQYKKIIDFIGSSEKMLEWDITDSRHSEIGSLDTLLKDSKKCVSKVQMIAELAIPEKPTLFTRFKDFKDWVFPPNIPLSLKTGLANNSLETQVYGDLTACGEGSEEERAQNEELVKDRLDIIPGGLEIGKEVEPITDEDEIINLYEVMNNIFARNAKSGMLSDVDGVSIPNEDLFKAELLSKEGKNLSEYEKLMANCRRQATDSITDDMVLERLGVDPRYLNSPDNLRLAILVTRSENPYLRNLRSYYEKVLSTTLSDPVIRKARELTASRSMKQMKVVHQVVTTLCSTNDTSVSGFVDALETAYPDVDDILMCEIGEKFPLREIKNLFKSYCKSVRDREIEEREQVRYEANRQLQERDKPEKSFKRKYFKNNKNKNNNNYYYKNENNDHDKSEDDDTVTHFYSPRNAVVAGMSDDADSDGERLSIREIFEQEFEFNNYGFTSLTEEPALDEGVFSELSVHYASFQKRGKNFAYNVWDAIRNCYREFIQSDFLVCKNFLIQLGTCISDGLNQAANMLKMAAQHTWQHALLLFMGVAVINVGARVYNYLNSCPFKSGLAPSIPWYVYVRGCWSCSEKYCRDCQFVCEKRDARVAMTVLLYKDVMTDADKESVRKMSVSGSEHNKILTRREKLSIMAKGGSNKTVLWCDALAAGAAPSVTFMESPLHYLMKKQYAKKFSIVAPHEALQQPAENCYHVILSEEGAEEPYYFGVVMFLRGRRALFLKHYLDDTVKHDSKCAVTLFKVGDHDETYTFWKNDVTFSGFNDEVDREVGFIDLPARDHYGVSLREHRDITARFATSFEVKKASEKKVGVMYVGKDRVTSQGRCGNAIASCHYIGHTHEIGFNRRPGVGFSETSVLRLDAPASGGDCGSIVYDLDTFKILGVVMARYDGGAMASVVTREAVCVRDVRVAGEPTPLEDLMRVLNRDKVEVEIGERASIHCKDIDGMVHVGRLSVGNKKIPNRSKIVSSSVSKELEELCVTNHYEVNTLNYSWARADFAKNGRTKADIPEEYLENASSYLVDKFLKFIRKDDLKAWSEVEVREGKNNVKSLNLNSAYGFPGNLYTTGSSKRGNIPDKGSGPVNEQQEKYLRDQQQIFEDFCSCQCVPGINTVFMKDEVYTHEQIQKQKQRTISAVNTPTQVAIARLFAWFEDVVRRHKIECGFAIGMSTSAHDILHLNARMFEPFDNPAAGDGDFSGFEKIHSSTAYGFIRCMFNEIFTYHGMQTSELALGVDTVIKSMCINYYNYEGDLFFVEGTMPSGHRLTSLFNCIFNYMYYLCAWQECGHSVWDFDKNVRLMVMGDDAFWTTKRSFLDLWNPILIEEAFRSFDIVWTPASDKFAAAIKEVPKEDIIFLGRDLRGRLREKAISKMIFFVRKTAHMSRERSTVINLNTALLEYSRFGKKTYVRKYTLFQTALLNSGIAPTLLSYERCRHIIDKNPVSWHSQTKEAVEDAVFGNVI